MDECFFFGRVPWGGGGRGAVLRVTVLVGILSMIGGKLVCGGGGACVTAFRMEMRWQCLTLGPVDLEEEDILIL